MAGYSRNGKPLPRTVRVTDWWGKYVGTPYTVLNCWQLVRMVYAGERGVVLPSYAEIDAASLVQIARTMKADADGETWQPSTAPEAFDVCLMRGRSAVWHVGVMTDPAHVLHSEKATDAVRVPINALHMRGRITGFRRYIGNE